MKYPIYNQQGKKTKDMELNPAVFEIKVKPQIIWEAVVAQRANSRQNIAHSKGRSEVRGGGRKPWRQKGTGRARHGSIRSPLWRGGGVTFGPSKIKKFNKKINKKVKQQAIKMSLSQKAQDKTINILDKLKLEAIKTKKMNTILKKLKLIDKRILLVLNKKDQTIIKSVQNIPNIIPIAANSLNVVDVLGAEMILTTTAAIKQITATYVNSR